MRCYFVGFVFGIDCMVWFLVDSVVVSVMLWVCMFW